MKRLLHFLFVSLRIRKYGLLSDCNRVSGRLKTYQPALLKGQGAMVFGNEVQIGVVSSAGYYNTYAHLESRFAESRLEIGDSVSINNNLTAVAFDRISIGNQVLIGNNCSIMDNDGHRLDASQRNQSPAGTAVVIGDNVFIGDNVTILKGVTIGKNSVIGANSVVTRSIPENSIAAGNPARVIKPLT